jgi:hypothetical protein
LATISPWPIGRATPSSSHISTSTKGMTLPAARSGVEPSTSPNHSPSSEGDGDDLRQPEALIERIAEHTAAKRAVSSVMGAPPTITAFG